MDWKANALKLIGIIRIVFNPENYRIRTSGKQTPLPKSLKLESNGSVKVNLKDPQVRKNIRKTLSEAKNFTGR